MGFDEGEENFLLEALSSFLFLKIIFRGGVSFIFLGSLSLSFPF